MKSYHNILIVDDSVTSRMIIQRCIEMAGLQVENYSFAENGLDALSKLKSEPGIDLIITDINMPKMDGQTLTRLIKKDKETSMIPIVIVSSTSSDTLEADYSALGAMAVIKKPISPAKLLQTLGGA